MPKGLPAPWRWTSRAILDQQPDDVLQALEPGAPEAESALPPLDQPPPPVEPAPPTNPGPPPRRTFLPWLLALLLIAALGGLTLWAMRPAQPTITVTAKRILPDHIPAGQTFPVLIRVTTSRRAPVVLILKGK